MKSAASLALAFATLERPQVTQRLILSVRRYFPDLPIYVADQSRHLDAMAKFYQANRVTVIAMPYDAGVTASRNRLALQIKEEYFVLCDDDFIVGADTSFDDALRILRADPEIGVVGGRLFDFDGEQEHLRSWELYLQYDSANKILFSIPIYQLAPKAREVGGVRYFLCDAVLNFSVFRRSIFSAGIRWDERFKSNGEHEDFYLNMKVNSAFKVCYLPTLIAYHHHPEAYVNYRLRLRDRNEGWRLFFEKWGLEQHIEFGLGVRTIDNIAATIPEEEVRKRFFVNPPLSLQRTESVPGRILIGGTREIFTVGALEENGSRTDKANLPGRLLVRTGAFPVPLSTPCASPETQEKLLDRYQLENHYEGMPVSWAEEPIHFRYDPVLRSDSDFFVWYFCDAPQRDTRGARRLAVVSRWWGSDGSSLVWGSRRMFIDLRPSTFWRPLFLEPPLMMHGCRWLRFDLVTDGGPSANPVCTGMLFPNGGPPGSDPNPPIDVLALARLHNDGASPGDAGRTLEDVAQGCGSRRVVLQSAPGAPGLSVLGTSELAGLEVLYFVGWNSLGRALVSARLPTPRIAAPALLALPEAGWSTPGGRVLGYGSNIGLVALESSGGQPIER